MDSNIKKTKLFIRECRYCGKKFYATYLRRVRFELSVHELTCKKNKR